MSSLIITSSGGGGHLAVARALQKSIPNSEELNVLNEKVASIWNRAQQKGDTRRQENLVLAQPLAEYFSFPFMFSIVKNAILKGKELPDQVISTQPLHLPAITTAIRVANWMRSKSGKEIAHLDLYLTDIPTKRAVHYLSALKRLKAFSPYAFSLIRIHVPLETKGAVENLMEVGLKKEQIIDTPWAVFPDTKLDELPLPHQETEITLNNFREGIWPEFASAGYESSTFNVKKEDNVFLLMLGSIPEEKAVMNYVDEFLALPEPEETSYFFVACGKASENITGDSLKKNSLYKKVCEKIAEKTSGSKIKVVPFIGQPVAKIFARSDFPLTRSGGITAAEHIELMKREGDDKKIFIHSPQNKIKETTPEGIREELLKEIPLWENGNARYLEENNGATITNPSLIGAAITKLLNPCLTA